MDGEKPRVQIYRQYYTTLYMLFNHKNSSMWNIYQLLYSVAESPAALKANYSSLLVLFKNATYLFRSSHEWLFLDLYPQTSNVKVGKS